MRRWTGLIKKNGGSGEAFLKRGGGMWECKVTRRRKEERERKSGCRNKGYLWLY
jgi:hypothetical protein